MAFVPGIDISEHQRDVDAPALATAGIRHAVVRCADPITNRIDHFYIQNHTALTAAGVECDTYVFARANLETPASAAGRYAAWARAVPNPGRLWIDVEWQFDGGRHNAAGQYIPLLPPQLCSMWLLELVSRLELDGWSTGIYTNRNYWDPFVGADARPAGRLPLWISGYPFVSAPPEDPDEWEAWATRAPFPRLPDAWRNAVEGFAIWQFSSSGTLVPGHGLDCNLVDPTLLTKDKPPIRGRKRMWSLAPPWAPIVGGQSDHYRVVDAGGVAVLQGQGACTVTEVVPDPNDPDRRWSASLGAPIEQVTGLHTTDDWSILRVTFYDWHTFEFHTGHTVTGGEHIHTEYAPLVHTHDTYAPLAHTHPLEAHTHPVTLSGTTGT